jgi:hypothetical protein
MRNLEPERSRGLPTSPAAQLRKLETIAAMRIKRYGLLFVRKPARKCSVALSRARGADRAAPAAAAASTDVADFFLANSGSGRTLARRW